MATGNIWPGREIGNYRIKEEIASGGFGIVFLAHHAILSDRPPVALKLMHTRFSTSEHREQFIQEAQLLERLHHPHILRLIDVGITVEGSPYLITVYAPCGSLRDLLGKEKTPLPLTRALQIVQHIGQALHFAHSQNILHRDLKPANVLFETPEHALLADFGIALVSEGNTVREMNAVGTPAYMAPEQFAGMTSKQSDQYALGCIAYELFTGRKLFPTQDPYQLMNCHVNQKPVPPAQINPDLPPHIEEAILTSLAKERSARYPDVITFIDALQALPPLEITTSTYNKQNGSAPDHGPSSQNPPVETDSGGVGADEDTPVGRVYSQPNPPEQTANPFLGDAQQPVT
ncbi:MAG: serine/threonine protein kinase, partial [Ktedonobacteraceae bacterium]